VSTVAEVSKSITHKSIYFLAITSTCIAKAKGKTIPVQALRVTGDYGFQIS
jgi:hypothetical protein